ncbi:hypothetical protein H5410_046519 [Solanum commersonii]|uniref:Uncharacterized protein n=1 Tax=Solanum commersonii TaxID=4109 RepID=A0A9J5XEJ1_SOLCO|nr:hypothetical protein H5410_046519 [Solanum commersonii]
MYRATRVIELDTHRGVEMSDLQTFGESPIGLEIAFCSSALSPEGKGQVSDIMEQSACRRVVPQSSTISPNDSKCEEAKG